MDFTFCQELNDCDREELVYPFSFRYALPNMGAGRRHGDFISPGECKAPSNDHFFGQTLMVRLPSTVSLRTVTFD